MDEFHDSYRLTGTREPLRKAWYRGRRPGVAPGMRARKDKMWEEAPVGTSLGSPSIPRLRPFKHKPEEVEVLSYEMECHRYGSPDT